MKRPSTSVARRPSIVIAALLLAGMIAVPASGIAVQETGEEEGRPISLSEAVELALRHNLEVRVRRMDRSLVEESVVAARAPFDPQFTLRMPQSVSRSTSPQASQLGGADVLTQDLVTAGASFSKLFDWGTSVSAGWNVNRSSSNNTFTTFNPRFNTTLSIDVTQPLLDGFGKEINRSEIRIARNDVEVTDEQFRSQVQEVMFQTHQAYWELVFAREDLTVKRQALELARQQLARNRAQVEVGSLAPIETVQAEQRVADARFQLVQTEMALEEAQDSLKELLNVEDAGAEWDVQLVPTEEPASTAGEVDVQEAVDVAMEHDPLLRQQRIDADSRELELEVARNALLPDLSLNGSFALNGLGGDQIIRSSPIGGAPLEVLEGGFGDAVDQLVSGEFRDWSLGLTLTIPLNNWQAEAQHARASIRERQVRARIEQRRQQIRVEIRRAVRQLETGGESVELARKARELAERQLEAEEQKFEFGTTTNFQVLELQRQLAEARTQEIRAVIDLNLALASLERAKGTLLPYLGVSIDRAGLGGGSTAAP